MRAVIVQEPRRRSALRMRLGTAFFCLRRRLRWHTGGLRFARLRPEAECPCLWAEHSTPLLRQLRGEEMALQRNKVTNLRLALSRLDGLTLAPGRPCPSGGRWASPPGGRAMWRGCSCATAG